MPCKTFCTSNLRHNQIRITSTIFVVIRNAIETGLKRLRILSYIILRKNTFQPLSSTILLLTTVRTLDPCEYVCTNTVFQLPVSMQHDLRCHMSLSYKYFILD